MQDYTDLSRVLSDVSDALVGIQETLEDALVGIEPGDERHAAGEVLALVRALARHADEAALSILPED